MNYTRTHFNSFFRENLHRLRRSLGEASNSEFSTPQTQKKGRKVLIATNAFSKQPLIGKSQGWLRLKPNPATEGTFRPFGLSDFAVLPSLSKAPRIISSLSALSPASPEEKGSAAGVDTNQIQKGLSLSVETVSNINDFKKSPPVKFYNQCFDKSRLKNFVLWFLLHYGEHKTVKLVEQLKTIGFDYASKAGISLGIDDLKIPPRKTELMYDAEKQTKLTINQYVRGEITGVERFQRLIDTWHRTSEILKQEVIEYFEATDLLNPVYMMAFSGARGNISQVRQLVGMRGLMADPQGQIIDFPIRSNFREGLTLTEYIISSYGARKGIVDTALRTANAGYLTRRLVDVAQHVIISNFDCGTRRGIFLIDMKEGNKTIHSLTQRAVGRILARDLFLSPEGTSIETFGQKEGESQSSLDVPPTENLIKVASRNQEINVELAFEIGKKFEKIFVRSPLTCETSKLICQLCYGWSLAQGNLVSIGEAVGVVAAQSIGEPGTQLTMRTFHTGGVFSGDISDQIRAPFDGIVEYLSAIPGTLIRTPEGKIAFLTKSEGSFFVRKVENSQTTSIESKKYKIPFYTLLYIRNGQKVYEKEVIAQISSISRKKNATDDAELTIKSEYEGQFYSKSLAFREKQVGPKQRLQKGSGLENKAIVLDDRRAYRPEGHNLAMDKFFEAWTWGYAWILSGKIYELQYTSPIFPKFGDRLNTKSSITQTNWKFDFNSGSAKLYLGTHFESSNVSNLNQTNKNWSLNNTISPFVNTSLNPLLPIQSSVSPKTLKRMTDQRGLKGVENSRSEFSSDSLGIQKWIGESKNSVMKPYISQPLVCFDLKKMSYQKQGYVLDLTDKFQFYSLDSNQKIRKIEQNQDSINLNKQGDRLRRISSNTKSTKSTFFSRSSLLGPPDALFYLKKLDSTKQNHLSPYILQWFPAFSHLKTGGYIFFDEGPEERFFKRSAASAKNVKAIKSLVDNRDSQANLFSFDTNLSKNNNLNRLIPEKEQKNFNTFQKFQNHKMDRRRSDSKEFGCSRLKGIRFSDKYHLLKQKILNSLNVPTSNSTTHQNSGQTRFISSEIIPLVKYSLFGMHWKNSYEMWISPTSSQRSFNQYENSELRNNSKMKKVTTVSLSSPTMSAKTVKKSLKRSYEVENSLREFSSDSLRMASLDEMRRNRISSNKNSTKLNLLKLSSSSSLYSMANQNDLMKFYSSRSLLIPNHFYKIEKKNSSFDPNGLSSQLAPSIPNSISERPQESFFTIQKYSEFFYVPFFILTNRQGCYKPLDIASKTSNTFSLLKVHISTNSIPKGISSVSSKNKPNSDFRDLENRRSRFSSTKSNLFRSTSMTAPSPYAGYHPKGHKGSKADLKTSFDSDRLGKWKNLSNRVKSMSTKLTRIRVNSLSTSSILFNEVNSLLQTNDINRDFESKKTRYLLNPKRLKRTDEVNSLSHKNQYRNSMKSNFVSQSNITSLYSFCKRYCGLTSTIEGKSHSILDFKNEKVINRNSLLSFYLSNEFQKISELPNSHYFSLAMADGNNFKHMKTPMPFRAVSGLSVDTWKLGTHDDGLWPKDVLDSQNADKNRDSTKYTLVRNRLRRSLGEASNGHPTKKQIFIHKEAFLKTLGFISYSEEIRQNQISNKNIKSVVNKTSPFSPLHGGKLKSIGTSRDLTKSNLFRFSKASPSNLLGPNRSSSDSRLASALTPASQAKKGQEVHKQIRYFNGKKGWVFFTNKTELNIHQKLIHPGSFIGSNLVTFNSPVFIESMLLNTVKFPDPLNEEITNKFSVCVTNEKSRYYLNESLSHHPVFSQENLKRNHEVEKSRSEFSTSSSLFRVSNEGPKSDGSSGLKSDQIILLIQPVEEYNHYDLHTEFQNSIYGLLPSKMNTEYKSLKTRIALRDRINKVDSLDPKGPSTQKITGATSNRSHADLKRIDKVKSLFSNPQTGLMKTKSLFAMDSVSYNKMKQMMIVTRGDRNSPLKRIGFAEENRLRRFSNSLADTHHKPILVNQSFESLYQWKQYRTHYWNKQKRSSQPILKYPSSDITILYNNLVNLFLSQDPAKRKRFSISGPFRDLTKSNLFRSTSKSRELTKSILFNHKFSNLSNGSSYRPSGHKATNSFLISRKALNVSSFILSYTKPFASNFSYKFTNSYFSYRSFSLADKRLDSQVSEKLVSLLTSYSRELENRRSRFSSTSSLLYCSLMPFKTVSPAIVENNYGSNSPLSSSLPVNNRGFQLNPSSRHGPSTDFSLIYALLPRVFESTCFGFDLISNFNQTLLNRGAEKISLRDQNKVPLGEKGRQTTTTKFTYSFTNNLNSLDTVATTNYYSPFTGEIVHITSLPKKNFISDVLLTLGNDVTSANFKNVENPLRGFSSGSTISSPAADTAPEGDESSLTLKAAAEANLLQKHQTEFIQPRCMILTKSDLISYYLPSTFREYKDIISTNQKTQYVMNDIFIRFLNMTDINFSNLRHYLQDKDVNKTNFKISQLIAGKPLKPYSNLLGDFYVYGDQISKTLAVESAGQIIHYNNNKITLRRSQPILVSPKGILHKFDGDFIDPKTPVITLSYQRLKTGDIIQGIPKVEQFFEARTTKRGRLFRDSLPSLLKALFKRYQAKLPLDLAVRQSFYKIQQILVDGVQRVYKSQGVTIADKHLEVIVKQMTSKVRIMDGAQTGFFPGEVLDLEFVEKINKFLIKKITYEPLVLGITKASLEVDSFLSAASFQQTTRVLSKAAISRKKDFLKGLKENVILGNLIPAGTGFLVYLNDFTN